MIFIYLFLFLDNKVDSLKNKQMSKIIMLNINISHASKFSARHEISNDKGLFTFFELIIFFSRQQ